MAKVPKIKWPSDNDTAAILRQTDMSKAEIEQIVCDTVAEAEKMVRAGLRFLAPALDGERATWEAAFNRNKTLTKWFGTVSNASQAKDVHRRLDDCCDRLANKTMKVKIRTSLGKESWDAQNDGGFLSPNTFKIDGGFLKTGLSDRARLLIHELFHKWFFDKKIEGEVVYGPDLAIQLAADRPRAARRNPDNLALYCEAQRAFDLAYAKKVASGSQPQPRN